MSQQDRSPAFQFYPKDFLSDPNVMMMTNAQVGAYIKLLCVCWQQDTLPNDDETLAILVGESRTWWKKFGGLIKACFRVRSRKLIHPRLHNEKQKQKKRREQAQRGAKTTNAKRYRNQPSSSHSDRIASQESRSPSPTPSPTPINKPPPPVCEDSQSTHKGELSCRVPEDWNPKSGSVVAINPGVDVKFELGLFRLHEFTQPRRDWQLAWESWLTRARPRPAQPANVLDMWATKDEEKK